MNSTEKNKPKSKLKYLPLFALFIVVVIFWFLTWYLLKDWEQQDRGTFGDMFGSINALFSGLALAGIIYTLVLQQQEISKQEEDNKTREKAENVKKFENTFFQMLGLHNDIVNRLMSDFKSQNRSIFSNNIALLKAHYCKKSGRESRSSNGGVIYDLDSPQKDNFTERKFIIEAYEEFFRQQGSELSHYFRNLYHIYKLIYLTNSILPNQKTFYANIVRAQLSDDELYLLFYNAFAPYLGDPKMRYLIKEYSILKNLVKEKLFISSHWDCLEDWEFEKNPFLYEMENEIYV